MKTLEELVKELDLKPSAMEIEFGRKGNFVHIQGNKYITFETDGTDSLFFEKVIEVKPE